MTFSECQGSNELRHLAHLGVFALSGLKASEAGEDEPLAAWMQGCFAAPCCLKSMRACFGLGMACSPSKVGGTARYGALHDLFSQGKSLLVLSCLPKLFSDTAGSP